MKAIHIALHSYMEMIIVLVSEQSFSSLKIIV